MNGQQLYSDTYKRDCHIWKQACFLEAGDVIQLTKRQFKLHLRENHRYLQPGLPGMGKYEWHFELHDTSNKMFACVEFEFWVI